MEYTVTYKKRNYSGCIVENGKVYIYSTTPKLLSTFMNKKENVEGLEDVLGKYALGHSSINKEVFRVDFSRKMPDGSYFLVDWSQSLGSNDTDEDFSVDKIAVQLIAEKGDINRRTIAVSIDF